MSERGKKEELTFDEKESSGGFALILNRVPRLTYRPSRRRSRLTQDVDEAVGRVGRLCYGDTSRWPRRLTKVRER